MHTLYIDHKDIEIRCDGKSLAIYQNQKKSGNIPFNSLDRILLYGNIRLSSQVLLTLTRYQISLTLLSHRHKKDSAQILGNPHAEAKRRIMQYQHSLDESFKIHVAQLIVKNKLLSQQRFLEQCLQQRKDKRHALLKAIHTIEQLIPDISAQTNTSTLLGMEGSAAAAYFQAFIHVFPPQWNFLRRNRRPPKDPVNACLSLAYSLLYSEAIHQCHYTGLDPLIGFFHELSYGHSSLASDMIEVVRVRADAWVWSLFRNKNLASQHFSMDAGACYLNKEGRKIYFSLYSCFIPPISRLLRRQCYQLIRLCKEDNHTIIIPVQEDDKSSIPW